jgi:thioredoxin
MKSIYFKSCPAKGETENRSRTFANSVRFNTKRRVMLWALPLMLCAVNGLYAQSNSGEVTVMNKADFLTKVYNYEKNDSAWVFEGKRPCIIDFYADWCGPCKRVAPVMKELALTYIERIDFYKVDVDKEKELAAAFGIRSIPTIFYVPAGGDPKVLQGAYPKEMMEKIIAEFLLKKPAK